MVDAANALLNDDDDGPTRFIDTNHDCALGVPDPEEGWRDIAIGRELQKVGYRQEPCHGSAWAGRALAMDGGGEYIVTACDVVWQVDNWWKNIPEDAVVSEGSILVPTPNTVPQTYHKAGGLGICNSSELIIAHTDVNGPTLLHELGHNQNLGHVDPAQPGEEYVQNIMNPSAWQGNGWICEKELNVVQGPCPGNDQDVKYTNM